MSTSSTLAAIIAPISATFFLAGIGVIIYYKRKYGLKLYGSSKHDGGAWDYKNDSRYKGGQVHHYNSHMSSHLNGKNTENNSLVPPIMYGNYSDSLFSRGGIDNLKMEAGSNIVGGF